MSDLATPSLDHAAPAGERRAARDLLAAASNYRSLTVALTLVIVWGFFYVRDPNDVFLSARNLSNLALQITVTGLLALGRTAERHCFPE